MSRRIRHSAIRCASSLILSAVLGACSPGGDAGGSARVDVQETLPSGGDLTPPTAASLGATMVVAPDTATVDSATPVAVEVLANDTLPANGYALTSVTSPGRGTATIDDNETPGDASDDTVVYTPQPGYEGPDSFVYTVSNSVTSGSAAVQIAVGNGPVAAGTTVCGAVVKGPLAGATLSLFAVDAAGAAVGQALAQTLTSETGTWCTRVPAAREPLLVVSSGGAFRNEADDAGGVPVLLGEGEALQTLLPATDTYAATTIYSYALLHRARRDAATDDFFDVYAQRREQFTAALGFDPLATAPADPAAPEPDATDPARRHAMALGGIANALTAAATRLGLTAPDHDLIEAFVRDISDCALDGLDATEVVLVPTGNGLVSMPAGIDLDLETLRFRNNRAAQYAGTAAFHFDTAACDAAAAAPIPAPDTTPPVFIAVPAPTVASGTTADGALASDAAIAAWLAGATARDNRDNPVVVTHNAPATFALGSTIVTFSVTDSAGNTMTAQSAVTVIDNTAPAFVGALMEQVATQGLATSFGLASFVTDPDGDLLTYRLDGLPDGTGLTIESATGVVSGVPSAVDLLMSPMTLTVRVSDGSFVASAPLTLTVAAAGVGAGNVAPVITGATGAIATPEDTPLTLTLADITVNDPDSVVLTLSVSSGANFAVAGTTVVPAPDFNGVLTVPIRVDDGTDTSAAFDLAIAVTAVNDAPTITAIAAPAPVLAGTTIGPLAFSIGDVETAADLLPVTATSDNQAVVADSAIALAGSGASRVVTLSPNGGAYGLATITLRVDDGEDAVAASFPVLVLDPQQDSDADGLSDFDETVVHLTDPADPDTDGDDVRDGVEVATGGDPLNPVATKVYVDPAATGGDGSSWGSAHGSLGDAAVAIAAGGAAGDPLYVLIGDTRTQPPGSDWAVDLRGAGCNGVALIGSLSPGGVLPVRDALDAPTSVLNVQGHGDAALVVDGCTNIRVFDVELRGGSGDLVANTTGGGVHVTGGAEVALDGVWITANTADTAGGGLAVSGSGSTVVLRNAVVRGNSVANGNGGGLYVGAGADLVVEGSEIVGNTADDEGGGFLVAAGGSMSARDTLVRGNLAVTRGGLFGGGGGSVRGALQLQDCVIADNRQTGAGGQPGGGALYIENDGPVDVHDCLLTGNFSQADGGAVLVQRIGAPVTLRNNLIVGNANDVGLGGGIHAVSIDTGPILLIESNTVAYNQTITGLGGFQSGGGIDIWGSADNTILRDNILWFNDDDVAGLQVDDNYYRHGAAAVAVEYNNIQTSTFAGSAGNISGSPLFEHGFYLHPTASPSVDAGSRGAVAAGLATPYGTSRDGSGDSGTLDQGFHYRSPSSGTTDDVVLTRELAGCSTGSVSLVFAPMVGASDTGPGRLVEAVPGAGNTAGGVLTARSTLRPFGTAGSVLAIDQGQGEYRVEVTGVDWSPGNRLQLDVRVDDAAASQHVLSSSELAPLFAAEGC